MHKRAVLIPFFSGSQKTEMIYYTQGAKSNGHLIPIFYTRHGAVIVFTGLLQLVLKHLHCWCIGKMNSSTQYVVQWDYISFSC